MSAYNNRVNYNDLNRVVMTEFEQEISTEDRNRLDLIRRNWDFYEGYHWEEVPVGDKPQITENYCRKFVDKFVAFELGLGFGIEVPAEQNDPDDTETPINKFLDEIWEDNNKESICLEMGQAKSVTGDGWIQVRFEKEDIEDPLGEYPDGRIRILPIPTNITFPVYDTYDKDKLVQLTLAYPIEEIVEKGAIIRKKTTKKTVYKQIWTNTTVEEWKGKEKISSNPNPYGIIPFVQIKNFPLVGRTYGISDLEDIIPLNMEMNLKKSDISEIIDYHSAPVTILFGAKVSTLEKGANKVWGGLPKDARVQNLELNSDLGASVGYVDSLKKALHEVGCVPEGSLGGDQAISNTSGVALQFMNMPLIERTRVKRLETAKGLKKVNKIILRIGVVENLISIPENMSNKEFYSTKITFPDTLPKDRLIELQQIEQEMSLGLESRMGAMKRLNKPNPTLLMEEIERERKEEMEKAIEIQRLQALANIQNQIDSAQMQSKFGLAQTDKAQSNKEPKNEEKPDKKLNSGMTNGQTTLETVRKESTGSNGMSK